MQSDTEDIDWELLSDVKASEMRQAVLTALAQKPMMNSDLAEELDVSTRWARKNVRWLEERGLVEDLTEGKPNYKLYRATEEGEKLVELL